MLAYLFAIISAIILGFLIKKNQDNRLGKFFAALLVIILSLIAGARSLDVGWDARKYVTTTQYRLEHSGTLAQYLNASTTEIGFSLLSYIAFKILPNFHSLLFAYSFVTTTLVMIFAFMERKRIDIFKVIVLYSFTLYLYSFNIIRQSISISLLLVALSLLRERKNLASCLLMVAGQLFHDSFILALPIAFMLLILDKGKNTKRRQAGIITTIASLGVLSFAYQFIIKAAYDLGIISSRYYSYITTYDNHDGNTINICINIFWLIITILAVRANKKNNSNRLTSNTILLIVFMLISALFINIISIKFHPIYRAGQYYYYSSIFILFPSIEKLFKKEENRRAVKTICYSFLIFYFIWITIIGNTYHIYPYN